MVKCKPKYLNLGLTSFSEQREITVQLLRQICQNDEWLYQHILKLENETNPAVRKRFRPIPLDKNKSFGCVNSDSNVRFNNGGSEIINLDFTDTSLIDELKTTMILKSRESGGSVIKSIETPMILKSNVNRDTKSVSPWAVRDEQGNVISDALTCNEHWYVGFDRNREYAVRPNWLEDQLNNEIPGIGRAQTFVPTKSGVLESITLNIKTNPGEDLNNTASPLIVQIRGTRDVNGVPYPKRSHSDAIAEQRVKFNNNSPDLVSVTFDHPCNVTAGETYAFVVLSPLSHPTHCYWLGGWNKHCQADGYPEGNAFFTFNNGMSWNRYGKDDDVEYHAGKYAPKDFAFECQIREETSEYETDNDHYLYLKPIRSNPVSRVVIEANDNVADSGVEFEYQVSQNGRRWFTVSQGVAKSFDTPESMTFVRVRTKMHGNSSTPARIDGIRIILYTEAADEMYARTEYYNPRTNPMLGANIWSRVCAPFTEEETVNCSVELISQKEVMEHFTTITVEDLDDYTYLDGIDENKIIGKANFQRAYYLESSISARRALQDIDVYVLPYYEENKTPSPYYFFNDVPFKSAPAYPIISCELQPTEKGKSTIYFGEWYDFRYNYSNEDETYSIYNPIEQIYEDITVSPDCLCFYTDVLESMPKGTFTVKYNPLLIDGLSNGEVGKSDTSDDDGDITHHEGLILDYFNETFSIDDTLTESRTLPLRTAPVDPIKKVVLNPDSDNTELVEDRDFTVDYQAHEIIFEESILETGDLVSVVYTPNIDDSGLALGYHAKRTNLNRQVNINPYYIEYKT